MGEKAGAIVSRKPCLAARQNHLTDKDYHPKEYLFSNATAICKQEHFIQNEEKEENAFYPSPINNSIPTRFQERD